MKSLSDILVVSITSLVIITFSTLLFIDLNKKFDAGDAKQIGEIWFKKKSAYRKFSTRAVWQQIEKKSPIYNYDSIKTEDDSEAVIKLADGTEIILNENSMILLSLNKKNISLDFRKGSIATKRTTVTGTNIANLTIKSGNTSVSAAKSNLNLSKGKKNDINLSVSSGSAVIKSGNQEKKIDKDQNAVIGKNIKVAKNNFTLLSPLANSYILSQKKINLVKLTWKSSLKGREILEISKEYSFNKTYQKRITRRKTAIALLPSGIYYWRVKSYNAKSKQYDFSNINKFSFISVAKPQLILPQRRESFYYRKKTPSVRFRWSSSEYPSTYSLVISKKRDFSSPVVLKKTSFTSLVLSNLPKGQYYWRVEQVAIIGALKKTLNSERSFFNVTEKMKIDKPILSYPPNRKIINKLMVDKGLITFSWQKGREITKTNIVITKNNKNVINRITDSNFIKLPGKLSVGNYVWYVEGILEDGSKTGPSTKRNFSIVPIVNVRLIDPPHKAQRTVGRIFGRIKFTWNSSSIPSKYVIEIAKDRAFGEVIMKRTSLSSVISLRGLKQGKLFWRVKQADFKDNVLSTSDIRELVLIKNLNEPRLRYPRNNRIVNMKYKNSLDFRWRRVKEADFYRFRLYRLTGARKVYILQKTLKNERFSLIELQYLSEGTFTWSIEAIDTLKGKVVRKSRIKEEKFRIILGEKIKKPEISTIKIQKID